MRLNDDQMRKLRFHLVRNAPIIDRSYWQISRLLEDEVEYGETDAQGYRNVVVYVSSAIETPTSMFVGMTHRVRKGTPLKRRDGNENTDVRQNSNGRAELYKDTQFAKAGYFDPFDQFVRDTGIACCAHLRVFALRYTDKGASKRALGWMLIGRNSLSSSLVSRKIS